jgi:hypothetical protein
MNNFTISYFNVLTRNQMLLQTFQNTSFFPLKTAGWIHKFDKVIKHPILQISKASTSTVYQFFFTKPKKKCFPCLLQTSKASTNAYFLTCYKQLCRDAILVRNKIKLLEVYYPEIRWYWFYGTQQFGNMVKPQILLSDSDADILVGD